MSYAVTVERHILNALFDIKGELKDVKKHLRDCVPSLPVEPNSYILQGSWKILYVGRNHWILIAPIADEPYLISRLRPYDSPASVSIVLISDTMKFFYINGPDAFDIMSIASSLNLNSNVFNEKSATFSEFFGLKSLILGDGDGYQFAVDQSFAYMVSDYLDLALAK